MKPRVTDWFGSVDRDNLNAAINAVPVWKRFVLCLQHYRLWKAALAYNRVAEHSHNTLGDWDLFTAAVQRGD